jgi:hypothetical protein
MGFDDVLDICATVFEDIINVGHTLVATDDSQYADNGE